MAMAGAKAFAVVDMLRQASAETDYDFYEEFQALPIADVLNDIPTSFLQDLLEDDLEGCEPLDDTGGLWLAPLELPSVEALAGLSSPSDQFGLQFDQQGLVLCPPSLAIRTAGKAATTELPEAEQQKAALESSEPVSPASDASAETPSAAPKGRRSRSVFEADKVDVRMRKHSKLAEGKPRQPGPGKKGGRPSRPPQDYLLSVMLKVAKMAAEERLQREASADFSTTSPPTPQTD